MVENNGHGSWTGSEAQANDALRTHFAHKLKANTVFVDGHAETRGFYQVPSLESYPDKSQGARLNTYFHKGTVTRVSGSDTIEGL